MARITYDGFVSNFLNHLSNLLNFSGTEGRKPYIMNLIAYWLVAGILTWLLPLVAGALGYSILSIAVMLVTWSSLVRRLRDTGLGNLGIIILAIIYVLPYLNIITVIYALFVDSKKTLF